MRSGPGELAACGKTIGFLGTWGMDKSLKAVTKSFSTYGNNF
jgi:hypothetical protein